MSIVVINKNDEVLVKRRFGHAFVVTFRDFCEISSIHGLKYIYDRETSILGRIIWVITVIVMLFCAVAMVYVFYEDFDSNPIRMNIESDHIPLTNLMFPAVTICPPTMYNYPQVKKIFEKFKLPPEMTIDEALDNLNQLYAVVEKVYTYDEKKLIALQDIIRLNNMTTLQFLKTIRWNCTDLLYRCRFENKLVNCTDVFSISQTYTGYCCSFNGNEFGFKFLKYPAEKFGLEGGLSVILKSAKTNQVGLDQFIATETEFIIHQNEDFPHQSMNWNSAPENEEIFAVIRPTEILCSEAFMRLPVKDRQCLLPHEHNMHLFSIYNSNNCEFECQTLSTFEACGCIPYPYVRNSNAEVCNFTSLPCLSKTLYFFENAVNTNNTIETTSACYCPSSCENLQYDVEITSAKLQTAIDSFDSFYDGIRENYTVLHIFMNSQVYRRLRRDIISDLIILVGNLGGSFALFAGMSIISLLEIGYFFTIVVWQNYTKPSKSK